MTRWRTDDPELQRTGTDDLPLFADVAARDRVLDAFEAHRPTIVQALRDEAHRLYQLHQRPVSANDVRPVLQWLGYDGDPRILVSAFPKTEWRVAGQTRHNAPGNHARRIFTYVPRAA